MHPTTSLFRRLVLFCILQSTLFLAPAWAQVPATVDFKKLDAYFANAQKTWGVPGISVGIVKDGKVVFTKGYGVLTQGTSTPVDDKTLYAIASNSKAFTSAIIGMLVQEGKLHWDDKVTKYLPYFALPDPYAGQNATLRDILSHRVGLGTFSGDIVWYNADFTSEEIIRRIKYLPSAYPFRAGYGYSNLMFITAGEIIKQVTGKSWYDNVKERILNPLGMTRTIVNIAQVPQLGNAASPHALLNNTTHQPIPYTSWEEIAATGGLISCVDDLCKWMIFNLNNGIHGKDTLLTPQTRTMVWSTHNSFILDRTKPNDFGSTFAGYGLGWGLRDYHGHLKVSHTGGYDGMITSVSLLPDQKLGVVILTNGLKAPINALPHYVFDAFLGRTVTDWSQKDLDRANQSYARDTRVADLKAKRIPNTKPTQALSTYAGTYQTDVYGTITVREVNGALEIDFEHTPNLAATLTHWHYDTFQLHWKKDHPWFTFGTVKFTTDNNQRVTGIEFEVPNDDFWFEELNAKKVR
ncbi:serine hydrolase [Rhabdobacter roseus]|uniref:CubicO group peptidase (Beta-lactamase class C family) n=1 Tax=Rhabdobacter roseus TaxID=1655419 RepID=A0A840TH74_9BACT|nr:serine hydrolase [Rhabdobacter roseus]MBB5282814.1 CubicO group peptidase (beta-lactamase class C family) [Rhabdobacter roseus]